MPVKLTVFVPPLVSLAIVAVWLIPDWNGQGPAAASGKGGEVVSSVRDRGGREGSSVAEQRAFNAKTASWLAMSGELGRLHGEYGSEARKALVRACRERILATPAAEVLAALEESDGPGYQGKAKEAIRGFLIHDLIDKDPQLLLGYFRQHREPGKPFTDGYVRKALANHARTSPEEAVAWLDGLISDGVFDSSGTARHNGDWLESEKALLEGLTAANVKLAEQRIRGIPADAREDLAPYAMTISEKPLEEQASQIHLWQKFLRKPKMRELLLDVSADAVRKGGMENLTKLLDQAAVTPQARSAMASSMTFAQLSHISKRREPGPQDVEEIRRWASDQGSRELGKVTGQAVTFLASRESFGVDRAYELVLSYHEKMKSDAMLAAFLANPKVWENRERAQELADRITDPGLRKKAIRKP